MGNIAHFKVMSSKVRNTDFALRFPGLDISDKAYIDTVIGFGWLLGKDVTRDQAAKELNL